MELFGWVQGAPQAVPAVKERAGLQSNLEMEGFRSLREGESVEFVTEVAPDGRQKAIKVTGPNRASPQVPPFRLPHVLADAFLCLVQQPAVYQGCPSLTTGDSHFDDDCRRKGDIYCWVGGNSNSGKKNRQADHPAPTAVALSGSTRHWVSSLMQRLESLSRLVLTGCL